jgi:hypothetical protein
MPVCSVNYDGIYTRIYEGFNTMLTYHAGDTNGRGYPQTAEVVFVRVGTRLEFENVFVGDESDKFAGFINYR